ncbi:DUF1549 and DUF1553 domain-containing protein [bacterium]|nr:DUF1549 and DUF1553 domain-containing protein [bacterium]MCI0607370.1 DUF1549 and DUF1553 domain-containing protein [bacterium]
MRVTQGIVSFLLAVILISVTTGSAPSRDEVASNRIDSSYTKLWSEKKVQPAPLSSDEEFLRRAYLDIAGRVPTGEQTLSFLNSKDSDKRQKLLGQLVDSPEFAEYFASLWTELFLGFKNDPYVQRSVFREWLQSKIESNTGWDKIATEMIVASGTLADSPELNWYARHKLDAPDLADDTSRLFLGIQLGCARCHNHPHEKWKLEDFYGLAAFYSGLKKDELSRMERRQVRQLKQKRQEMMEKHKTADVAKKNRPEMVKQMREEFRDLLRMVQEPTGSITTEIQGKSVVYNAKFLLEPKPSHATSDQRKQLAAWITSPSNPYFAHAFVNRIWGLIMGKGFVHPVDDMGGSNLPSNPQLLNDLAADFKQRGFDVKHLVFQIANSQTYQLTSKSTSREPPLYYERGKVQMLNPNQLVNSFLTATSIERALRMKSHREFEERKEMIYLHHVFLFDNDDTKSSVEFEGTIPQALFLLNGRITNEAVQPMYANTIEKIVRLSNVDTEEKIDQLFIHVLSRHATKAETGSLLKHVQEKGGNVSAYEDIFWALLNSNEFLFNH